MKQPCESLAAINVAGQEIPEGILGFNSGATKSDSDLKDQSDFEEEFNTAQALRGSPGLFNSVRLYTMIQAGTTNDPILAFPAAFEINTSMLLRICYSSTETIENELTAMNNAINTEDLYRSSESGVEKEAGLGQGPDIIVQFICKVRSTIKGTILGSKPVGHLSTDLYPYYKQDKGNSFMINPSGLLKLDTTCLGPILERLLLGAIDCLGNITEDLSTTARFNLTCAPDSGAPAAINLQSESFILSNRSQLNAHGLFSMKKPGRF
ncbi:GPI-anchored cell wall beta-1,3-endoglucanase EglC [Dactylonectria estremocensis]|uniref:GPI-anchored cell wall beta-1,3-endoglucanase EglC n=1 Tax=Dactylonectria estremocensis TaxID=1079267 RepID=A0A9P9J982_9HYPO|nr:GPI-anchored cell wall beta-1,3-endoglucanase EglC [Dactylonectria estremocensis]